MKYLIVALNFAPELTGIGKYTGEMAEWLTARGHAVRVVAAPPFYPGWKLAAGHRAWRYRFERVNGARVIRCPLFVPRVPTPFNRIVHLASFAFSSLPVVLWTGLAWRPEIVFVVEPPLLCSPAALVAAWLGRSFAWLHVQDFELDAAFELSLLRSRLLRRVAGRVEAWLMRRFSRVSTIADGMRQKLIARGVAASRTYLLPNWVDIDAIGPLTANDAFRAEVAIPSDKTVVLYSGNFGFKQGLELVVDCAKRLEHRADIAFVLCGDGPTRGGLEVAARGLSNVIFLPLQPASRLNELLNLADIHALPQRANAEDLLMPSKLSAMMASGRPVVATARSGSELARLVAIGGQVVEPGDVDAFAAAVVTLSRDPERRRRLGNAGRELARQLWSRNNVLHAAVDRVAVTTH